MTDTALNQMELNKLRRYLAEIEDTAKAATPGKWSRNHGVIVAAYKKEGEPLNIKRAVVALTDPVSLRQKRINYGGGRVYSEEPEKDAPNARHIMATSPGRMLELIEIIRKLLPPEAPSQDTPEAPQSQEGL